MNEQLKEYIDMTYEESFKESNEAANKAHEELKLRAIGKGVGFERVRRITGYLVGTLDRFNNAKKAEVLDRVKHGVK